MSNGIGIRQNEAKSIAMLAAQRQLYNEVGVLDVLNIILLVVLPLAFAIMQEIGAPWSWIRFLSYGLSLSIGAGAVVARDIPDNSVAVGVPARVIKTADEYLEKLKRESLHLGHLKGQEKDKALMEYYGYKGDSNGIYF